KLIIDGLEVYHRDFLELISLHNPFLSPPDPNCIPHFHFTPIPESAYKGNQFINLRNILKTVSFLVQGFNALALPLDSNSEDLSRYQSIYKHGPNKPSALRILKKFMDNHPSYQFQLKHGTHPFNGRDNSFWLELTL